MRSRFNSVILTLILLIFLFPLPANSSDQQDNALKLKNIFDKVLIDQQRQAKLSAAELLLQGDVIVRSNDDYYSVTLPAFKIQYNDGSYINIDKIAINAMASKEPELWKMTIAFPTPIVLYNRNNTPELEIDFSSQNLAGIWHESFQNFIKLNAQYKDIKIIDKLDKNSITIPSTKISLNLEEGLNNRWSGPALVLAKDIHMNLPAGAQADIGEFRIKMEAKDYSITEMKNYRDKIQAITESDAFDNQNPSWNHVLAIYSMILEFAGEVWDGFDVKVTMDDFSTTRPPIPGSEKGEIIIGSASMGFEMSGLQNNSVTLGLSGHYSDFSAMPMSAEIDKTTPDHIHIDASVNNLPYKELIKLGQDAFRMIADSPESSKIIGLNALLTAPQILTTANTNIMLQDLSFGNPDYDVEMNGNLYANMKALLSATGSANLKITGLDNMLDYINKQTESAELVEPQTLKGLKDIASALTMLQLTGQKNTAPDGRTVHDFMFELTEDGKTMLNGTDMSAMIQPGAGE